MDNCTIDFVKLQSDNEKLTSQIVELQKNVNELMNYVIKLEITKEDNNLPRKRRRILRDSLQ